MQSSLSMTFGFSSSIRRAARRSSRSAAPSVVTSSPSRTPLTRSISYFASRSSVWL